VTSEKKMCYLTAPTTVVGTLFSELVLASQYSSHRENEAMLSFGFVYVVILSQFVNCTKRSVCSSHVKFGAGLGYQR
jgi:hypothetical protein